MKALVKLVVLGQSEQQAVVDSLRLAIDPHAPDTRESRSDLQPLVAAALSELVSNADCCAAGVLDSVVKFGDFLTVLLSNDASAAAAVDVVWRLVSDPNRLDGVIDAGCVPGLCHRLEQTESARQAVAAISRVEAHLAEVLRGLMVVLRRPDAHLRGHAVAQVLEIASRSAACRDAVAGAEAVAPLVSLLVRGNGPSAIL